MAQLDTTRNFNDGEVLTEADLDAFLDDIETFLNVTKINDDNIQNSGITGSTKLLNQSVTNSKLASNAVTTLKIADQAVTTAKLVDNAVTTAKITDANVTAAKLATDSVETAKIVDANVTTAKLADDSVTAAKLADSASVDADRAVTTDHIRDAAITTAKINAGAVTGAKLATRYASGTLSGTTTSSSLSITASGRLVKASLVVGQVLLTQSGARLDLQYSPDNSSWSFVSTLVYLQSVSGTLVQVFGGTSASSTSTSSYGTVTGIHTPAAGTAYYRVVITSGGSSAFSNLTMVVEEL